MPIGKPYHHGNLRSALLKASLNLIRQKGSRGFTIREVARRGGVSHTAPYRHFRDKDDLLAAIAEEGFFRLTASLKGSATKDWQPFAYVEFALERPEEFGVMFSTDWDEKLHPTAKAAARESFETLVSLVGACSRTGSTNCYYTITAARIAWVHTRSMAEFAMAARSRIQEHPGNRELHNDGDKGSACWDRMLFGRLRTTVIKNVDPHNQ